MSEGVGPLNLSGSDSRGFQPAPSGTYVCAVKKVEWQETKGGPEAVLPKGTPRLNVQFRILGKSGEEVGESSPYYNKPFFNGFIIPPDKVNGKKYEHKQIMLNNLANFLVSCGYSHEEVTSGDFNIDTDDLVGKELQCRVKIEDEQNRLVTCKPLNEDALEAGSGIV